MNNTPNTNNIWPNSTPRLNPNKPGKILPEFISVFNKNPPKPKPWMSPNTIVININKLSLFFKFSFRKKYPAENSNKPIIRNPENWILVIKLKINNRGKIKIR